MRTRSCGSRRSGCLTRSGPPGPAAGVPGTAARGGGYGAHDCQPDQLELVLYQALQELRPAAARRVQVSKVDPRRLGVHRVIGGGPMPAYVRRPHDELLLAVLDPAVPTSRLVVVRGGSSTGKSRAAYEAVVARLANWYLDYPLDSSPRAGLRLPRRRHGSCMEDPPRTTTSRLVGTAGPRTANRSSSCGRRTYAGMGPPPITRCTPSRRGSTLLTCTLRAAAGRNSCNAWYSTSSS